MTAYSVGRVLHVLGAVFGARIGKRFNVPWLRYIHDFVHDRDRLGRGALHLGEREKPLCDRFRHDQPARFSGGRRRNGLDLDGLDWR